MNPSLVLPSASLNHRVAVPTAFTMYALFSIHSWAKEKKYNEKTIKQIKQTILDNWKTITNEYYLSMESAAAVTSFNWAQSKLSSTPKQTLVEIHLTKEECVEHSFDGIFDRATRDSQLFGEISQSLRDVALEAKNKNHVSLPSVESNHNPPLPRQKIPLSKGHLKKQSRHAHLEDFPPSPEPHPRPKKNTDGFPASSEQNISQNTFVIGASQACHVNVEDHNHSVLDFDEHIRNQSDPIHTQPFTGYD